MSLIDALFGGIEAINSDGSVTLTVGFRGLPLMASVFNRDGSLRDLRLFGVDVYLSELLGLIS